MYYEARGLNKDTNIKMSAKTSALDARKFTEYSQCYMHCLFGSNDVSVDRNLQVAFVAIPCFEEDASK